MIINNNISIKKIFESQRDIKQFLKNPHTKYDLVAIKHALEKEGLTKLAKYVTYRLITFDKHL